MLAARTLIPISLLIAVAIAAPARAQVAEPGQPVSGDVARLPRAVTLDSGWQFRADPANEGLAGGWSSGRWEDAWSPIEVPHVFEPQPLDALFGGTIGWYRMRFEAPSAPPGFGWAFEFEGVRRESRAWLNGVPIGSNRNPYQRFRLPAEGLRPGTNELVLRVHNIKQRTVREGWWNWGGIIRPVSLVARGRVAWEDVGLLSDVDCSAGACRAIVRADGWVRNRTDVAVSPDLTVELRSPAGAVSSRTVTVPALQPGERRRVRFPLSIQGRPQLWSPRNPYLYTGYVAARVGGELQQWDARRAGLRYIRVQDGGLYLNGHRLQLRGASVQEDLPGRGPALRDADIERVVADLKALNANVTRAHYLLNERLLDRLDEEGIMVWSQAPVYHEDAWLRTSNGMANALAKVRGTVLAARNHPSVMTHSVANELAPEPDRVTPTHDFMVRAARLARSLDHTVPASIDLLSYPRIPHQRAYVAFGLLGINTYYGWYRGKRDNSTEKLSDLAPYLEAMRRKYPRQAMAITEFGAEATMDGPSNVKETYAFQSRYVGRVLDVVDRLSWLSGAIYWTAREFYVKPNWDGGAEREGVVRDALHNKGLLHYDGTPKPSFEVAARRFGETPLYREP